MSERLPTTRRTAGTRDVRGRRPLKRGLAVGAAVAVGFVASAPLADASSSSSHSQTFSCSPNSPTGGRYDWTVPAGVTQLRVQMSGGQGQGRKGSSNGGLGGTVNVRMPVTPGHVLGIWAGCSGERGGLGFGSGGDHGVASEYQAQDGGFGGGGSGIYDHYAQKTMVVAGGGGGGGGLSGGGGLQGQGGDGGAGGFRPKAGKNGSDGVVLGVGLGPKGGCGGCAGFGNIDGLPGGNSNTASASGGGGGGGGGYIGGAGGAGVDSFAAFEGGGGGGGGLSYVDPSLTATAGGRNASGGDGSVIVTWRS